MERSEIESEFSRLRAQLRVLEHKYNPAGHDLHLYAIEPPDAALFVRFAELAREGLLTVQEHRAYFASRWLYSDGMFWYRLFLLIIAAARSTRSSNKNLNVPDDVVEDLVRSLVAVSEWSAVQPNDIYKRSFAALVGLLLTFPSEALISLVDSAAQQSPVGHTKIFVHDVLGRVQQIIERRASRPKLNDE